MKQVLKAIGMILIAVMLVNTVTSCILINPALGLPYGKLGQTFDLIVLGGAVVFAIVYLITGINFSNLVSAPIPNGGISIASGNQTHFFLEGSIEQSSFMGIFNALPETQIDTLTKKVQAAPETEIITFMETFSAMSQTDRISVMDTLSTVSETELADTVRYLNSLSETEFIALLRNIQIQSCP